MPNTTLNQRIAAMLAEGQSLQEMTDWFQARVARVALHASGNNQSAAAEMMGVHRNTMHRICGRLHIQLPEPRRWRVISRLIIRETGPKRERRAA